MTTFTQKGESIEGKVVKGQNRDPLINRGLKRYNNKKVYRFVASFDNKSEIIKKLESGLEKIEPNSAGQIGDNVICEKSLIHSFEKRYGPNLDHISSSHKGTTWQFSGQTAVRVMISHPEIANAIEKRKFSK
jgi:hypothetical protein